MLNLSLLVQDSNLHEVPKELGALLEEAKLWNKKQEYVSQHCSHSFFSLSPAQIQLIGCVRTNADKVNEQSFRPQRWRYVFSFNEGPRSIRSKSILLSHATLYYSRLSLS